MRLSLLCVLLGLLVSLGTPSLAQEVPSRYELTAEDVARSLQDSGLKVDASLIRMPAAIKTVDPRPELELKEVTALASAQLQLRFGCKVQKLCMPFFAFVDLSDSSSAREAQRLLTLRMEASTSPARRSHLAVLAGQRATLFLDNRYLHITLPVISVDSGVVGGEIRVTSLDRKQTFHGTVMNDSVVRAMLP